MIELTRYIVSTGEIRGWLRVGTEQEVTGNVFMLPSSEAFTDGIWEADTHYILNDTATLRPATGLPASHTVPASTDWTIPDVPAGTEVEIDGEVMGVTDETGLTLSFDAPGIWPVTLRPPFPWIAATCEVTVT